MKNLWPAIGLIFLASVSLAGEKCAPSFWPLGKICTNNSNLTLFTEQVDESLISVYSFLGNEYGTFCLDGENRLVDCASLKLVSSIGVHSVRVLEEGEQLNAIELKPKSPAQTIRLTDFNEEGIPAKITLLPSM